MPKARQDKEIGESSTEAQDQTSPPGEARVKITLYDRCQRAHGESVGAEYLECEKESFRYFLAAPRGRNTRL